MSEKRILDKKLIMDYKDNVVDFIDKVNAILKQYNLEFIWDGRHQDGDMTYNLVDTAPKK